MNTTIVGLLCSAGTLIIKTIIDLCVKRYEKAQETKAAREDREAGLRKRSYGRNMHMLCVSRL